MTLRASLRRYVLENHLFTDDEMVPENLDSIDNLVAYIARKQAAAS